MLAVSPGLFSVSFLYVIMDCDVLWLVQAGWLWQDPDSLLQPNIICSGLDSMSCIVMLWYSNSPFLGFSWEREQFFYVLAIFTELSSFPVHCLYARLEVMCYIPHFLVKVTNSLLANWGLLLPCLVTWLCISNTYLEVMALEKWAASRIRENDQL